MSDDDDLKPGVDKPKGGRQYLIGVLIIAFLSLAAYWWLGRH